MWIDPCDSIHILWEKCGVIIVCVKYSMECVWTVKMASHNRTMFVERWMWREVCNCSLWLGYCQASPPDPGTRVPQIWQCLHMLWYFSHSHGIFWVPGTVAHKYNTCTLLLCQVVFLLCWALFDSSGQFPAMPSSVSATPSIFLVFWAVFLLC